MAISRSLRLVVVGAIACLAPAQVHPHFGMAVGVPLTDTFASGESGSVAPGSSFFNRYNSKTKRLLIGPAFRLDFQSGFGLEFDALWQRVNYDTTTQSSSPPTFASYSFGQTTANRWQFPLLVQYSHALPKSKTSGFVQFGPAIAHIADTRSTFRQSTTSPSSATTSSTTSSVSSFTGGGGTQAGVTAGAGFDATLFGLHLRPQFRYSRWFQAGGTSQSGIVQTVAVLSGDFAFTLPTTGAYYARSAASPFDTQSNEATFLLEIVF